MKLLSGGQSGVDRAVLYVALARGIAYGGWCPKGGWAEDFPEPPGVLAKYPQLAETPLADPAQRTEWNVRDADACLIVVDVGGLEVSHGTALARDQATYYGKPLFIADLGATEVGKRAAAWLGAQRATFGPDLALVIGGPESEARASVLAPSPSSAGCSIAERFIRRGLSYRPGRAHPRNGRWQAPARRRSPDRPWRLRQGGLQFSRPPACLSLWTRSSVRPRLLRRRRGRDAAGQPMSASLIGR